MRIFTNKAFTLVELLIVMAIIAVLIAISAYGIGIVMRNSRNSQRASFINDFKIGLEKFYSNYGTYPDPANITFDSDETKIVMSTASGSASIEVKIPSSFLKPASNTTTNTSAYCYVNTGRGLYSLQYLTETQTGTNWSIQLGTSDEPCTDTILTI